MKNNIVLTGGIASGKTFVSDYLATLNAFVIDTDVIARSLLVLDQHRYSDIALKSVYECFGDEVFNDGAVDRKKLRNIIFSNSDARKQLENIMHPLIFKSVQEDLQKDCGLYNVISVPLLRFNSPYLSLAHKVLVVEVDQNIQLQRLMLRDNIDKQLAMRIIESQASNQERRNLANTIIINTNVLHTRNILKQLDKQYSLALFK
ncbi:dephospho-CoA kinase [Wohlfahrtiimonas larvae]|uniref:Dephospho-CoA kinase n=1 Tax=Wohlfahrtiimonas larvae TaxID=1157986 RepID=A0ABP9MBN1_9GAMM|nr:dephospho-CoA kinase [Wohlfahrtiimonas larvae]